MQMRCEPIVMTCHAKECSYNSADECFAPAIEIGDVHPKCDMFTTGEVTVAEVPATVQDCLVSDCHFNHQLLCLATGVTVATHADHADCMTYRR